MEVFRRDFETDLEAFTLATNCTFAMTEFSVEELLGDAVVMHTGDVTCPSQLGLACDGSDAGETCPMQNLCAGNFVLPTNVQKAAGASKMEVVEDLFLPSVPYPGFCTIE